MIVVRSKLPNAVELRVDDLVEIDPGVKIARRRAGVVLKPGSNEISADFWQAWRAQNAGGLLITHFAAEEPAAPSAF